MGRDRKEILALPKYEEYAIHFMGLPGWIYRNIDDKPDEVQHQLNWLVRRVREMGARYLRTFLMNGSRKASEKYMMDCLPWKLKKTAGGLKTDFKSHNEKFFEVIDLIEKTCKYWQIQHRPTMLMDRYNYDVFREVGFWSPKGLELQQHYFIDVLERQKKHRAKNFKPTFEIMNEPFHHGSWEFGAKIADHHLALFRAVEDLTRIDRVWTCSGTSEFAHAQLVEPQWFASLGRWLGSEEFRSRKIKPEWHGVSTLQTLFRADFEKGVGSGWRHQCYNEDGSDDGSYRPIPWTDHRLANRRELFDMLWYAIRESRKHRKKFYFTAFAMDCLKQDPKDGVAKEEFWDIPGFKWSRYAAYKAVREELRV